MSTTTTEVVGGQKVRRTKRRVEPIYYLFLLPSLILLTLFSLAVIDPALNCGDQEYNTEDKPNGDKHGY